MGDSLSVLHGDMGREGQFSGILREPDKKIEVVEEGLVGNRCLYHINLDGMSIRLRFSGRVPFRDESQE